MSLIKNMIKK